MSALQNSNRPNWLPVRHPLSPNLAFPCGLDGAPLVKDWHRGASASRQKKLRWQQRLKPAYWALPCGPASGAFAVDIFEKAPLLKQDDFNPKWLDSAAFKYGIFSEKGSGGKRFCFLWEDRLKAIKNSQRVLPRIEVMGQGDYAIIPIDWPDKPFREILSPMPDGLFSALAPLPLKAAIALALLKNPLPSGEWRRQAEKLLKISRPSAVRLLCKLKGMGLVQGGGSGPHSPPLRISYAGRAELQKMQFFYSLKA